MDNIEVSVTAHLLYASFFRAASDGTIRLRGEIYKDKDNRFPDGWSVETSPVLAIKGPYVITKNSVYKVRCWARRGV